MRGMTIRAGEYEMTTYMEVKKADGRVMYYVVRDGQQAEITHEEYLAANQGGQ